MFITSCLWALAIFGTTNGQVFSMGNCDPSRDAMNNFDRIRYVGKWYMIKQTSIEGQDITKCFSVNCTLAGDNGLQFHVNFAMKDDNIPLSYNILATVVDEENPGKYEMFPGLIAETQPGWFLDTDYENYSVMYSCMNSYRGKIETVWIASRSPSPDEAIIKRCERFLKRQYNINLHLEEEVQDCEEVKYLYYI